MSLQLQIKRGNENNKPSLLEGEYYYATDTKKLYIGDDVIADVTLLDGSNADNLHIHDASNLTTSVTGNSVQYYLDIVEELKDTHNMKQIDMAKRLNVSQSAISQYSTQSRGAITDMRKFKAEFDEDIRELASLVANGENEDATIEKLCSLCRSLQKEHFDEILCDVTKSEKQGN